MTALRYMGWMLSGTRSRKSERILRAALNHVAISNKPWLRVIWEEYGSTYC